MQRTNLIWWRYGKEHERHDPAPPYIRANTPEVAQAALDHRLARHNADPEQDWRIWQVAPQVIVERPALPYESWAGPDTFFYYLLDQGIAAMENFHSRRYGAIWYLHICEYFFDEDRACWIMKDLFTDLLVRPDNSLLSVLDLDDLANAQELGLVSAGQVNSILRLTQQSIYRVNQGEFPFPGIVEAQQACRELGWLA